MVQRTVEKKECEKVDWLELWLALMSVEKWVVSKESLMVVQKVSQMVEKLAVYLVVSLVFESASLMESELAEQSAVVMAS